MIYIIDEKKHRQANYGWSESRLNKNKNFIKAIYSTDMLQEMKSEKLFEENNVILFHDSFFDDPKNRQVNKSESLKSRLKNKSEKAKIVFFSGGYPGRTVSNSNYATMHVSWVYKNLAYFLAKYKEEVIDLRFLAFGKNYKYERLAELRLQIWRYLYTKKNTSEKFVLPDKIIEDVISIKDMTGYEANTEDLETEPQTVSYFKFRVNDIIKKGIHE